MNRSDGEKILRGAALDIEVVDRLKIHPEILSILDDAMAAMTRDQTEAKVLFEYARRRFKQIQMSQLDMREMTEKALKNVFLFLTNFSTWITFDQESKIASSPKEVGEMSISLKNDNNGQNVVLIAGKVIDSNHDDEEETLTSLNTKPPSPTVDGVFWDGVTWVSADTSELFEAHPMIRWKIGHRRGVLPICKDVAAALKSLEKSDKDLRKFLDRMFEDFAEQRGSFFEEEKMFDQCRRIFSLAVDQRVTICDLGKFYENLKTN